MEDLMMHENPQVNSSSHSAVPSIALGFVVGALVWAGIALLVAPATGKETRGRLRDAGRRLGGAARSTYNQVRDTASDLKHHARSALEAGREAFEQSKKSRESLAASRTELKS
jgi:gas vesicle protein